MKSIIPLLIFVFALASCSAGVVVFEFYVVIKPSDTAKFIEAVTAIGKQNGLETAAAEISSDTGNVFRFVEGRGYGVKLWAQNVVLSGQEDPKLCGVRSEPYSDPAQFQVSTEPRFFGSKAAATELGERILGQIQKAGFDVRREPAVCGAAALHE